MDINIEEIFKMTVFDYKVLEQVDVLKEIELFDQVFTEQPKQIIKVDHEHPEHKPEKLGRSMRACRGLISDAESERSRKRSVDINDVNVDSPKNSLKSAKTSNRNKSEATASIYNSELDKMIKENKDSYFLKLLMQDDNLITNNSNN